MSAVSLSKTLKTHKGDVRSIELKEPTARSFVNRGEPFKVRVADGKVSFDYDNRAMIGFLSDMTGHDEIILETLPARDYVDLRNAATSLIMGIVGEENPTQPSDQSSQS